MSALENLLAEVRVEAEVAVRTEYENTVVNLREQVGFLADSVASLELDRDQWYDAYQKLVADYDALVERVQAAIGR
jgi:hypothetical protein